MRAVGCRESARSRQAKVRASNAVLLDSAHISEAGCRRIECQCNAKARDWLKLIMRPALILLRRAAAAPIACWVHSAPLPSSIAAISRPPRAATSTAPHPCRPKQPLPWIACPRHHGRDGDTDAAIVSSGSSAAPPQRQACRPTAAAAAARPALASAALSCQHLTQQHTRRSHPRHTRNENGALGREP